MTSFERERQIAIKAVESASKLTCAVFEQLCSSTASVGTVTKEDKSPVTIADFGAQAVVVSILTQVFPDDLVVGEEDASLLREDEKLREQVWELVKHEITSIDNAETMMSYIDRGNYHGKGKGRIWVLDPIDGTKGFLRGGQYAVCLALIEDGRVVVGAISVPNMGIIEWAVAGRGAYKRVLYDEQDERISMRQLEHIHEAILCESVDSGHSAQHKHAYIAQLLGMTAPPVRMDSQAKYTTIAKGDADIYLRLPVNASYREKIWDHAAGYLIVNEAGGIVTDIHGKELDFSQGRTLSNNVGIIAAQRDIHSTVVEAVCRAESN